MSDNAERRTPHAARLSSNAARLSLAITGTGTGVGKTRVTTALVRALRLAGRRVWVHKPVACGEWDGSSAEDGRLLRAMVGDGQPAETVCPLEFPEPASPHLAAAAAGGTVTATMLDHGLHRCEGDHDLLVEGAGGLLAPLTTDRLTFAELLPRWGLPLLIVTRPDLGTLNHTALTVRVARAAGIPLLGLVLNEPCAPDGSLAQRQAAAELEAVTGLRVLCRLPHGAMDLDPEALAGIIRARP